MQGISYQYGIVVADAHFETDDTTVLIPDKRPRRRASVIRSKRPGLTVTHPLTKVLLVTLAQDRDLEVKA